MLPIILLHLGECARIVVAENRTNVWEIYVRLLVTTQPRNDNIDDDQGQHLSLATQVVDSFEKVEETDSCSMDRCAICLEEFYEGSKSELVKTLCSHVFHKECVVKWFRGMMGIVSFHSLSSV
ncbi:hypothetical protein RJT34_12245 [Clitoria ternatea]|uniref:RING-type domain-containing protein n=1 Tax=Clitoria ternatea TaxID=43366 RepID=A0AAN9PL70_CLITE